MASAVARTRGTEMPSERAASSFSPHAVMRSPSTVRPSNPAVAATNSGAIHTVGVETASRSAPSAREPPPPAVVGSVGLFDAEP